MATTPPRLERRLSGPCPYWPAAEEEKGWADEKVDGEHWARPSRWASWPGQLLSGCKIECARPPLPSLTKTLYTTVILLLGAYIGSLYPVYTSIYTRRSLDLPSLRPPALTPAPSSLLPSVPSLPAPHDPIPNILHYVYGLKEQTDDFPYFAYLAVRSALITLEPEKVMFHCVYQPSGYWWDRLLEWEGETHGKAESVKVEVVKAREVEWIGPQRRPVEHYAHKADILRLEVLLEYGGIYLDIDTFIVRPFAPYGLMRQDVVLGMEAHPLNPALMSYGPGSDDGMHPKGLCNGVIIARPGAEFLRRWMTTYEEAFDSSYWEYNSVEMPWLLAKLYPTLLTVLSDRAFFWPLYTKDHIHAVHSTTDYDFSSSGQLAYHAWESLAKDHLGALTPENVRLKNSSFTRLVRPFQASDEEVRWKAALGELSGGAGLGSSWGVGQLGIAKSLGWGRLA